MFYKLRGYICMASGVFFLLISALAIITDSEFTNCLTAAIGGFVLLWWGNRLLRASRGEALPERGYLGPTRKDYGLQWLLFKKHAWHTGGLIALNLLAFWWVNVRYHATSGEGLTTELAVRFGANFATLVNHWQVWRLATAAFLHVDGFHLFGNMLALLIVGRYIDYYYGVKRFYWIYFTAAVVGNLVGDVMHPTIWGVGASGAIFGLYGAFFITFIIKHPDQRAVKFSVYSMVYMGGHILKNLSAGFGVPGIDNAAHVGGFITGAALGYIMLEHRYPVRMIRDGVLATLAVAFLGLQFTVLPHSPSIQTLQAREKSIREWEQIRKSALALGQWLEDIKSIGVAVQERRVTEQQINQIWHAEGKPAIMAIRKGVYEIKTTRQDSYQAQIDLYKSALMLEKFFTTVNEGSSEEATRAIASSQNVNAVNLYKQAIDEIEAAIALFRRH